MDKSQLAWSALSNKENAKSTTNIASKLLNHNEGFYLFICITKG